MLPTSPPSSGTRLLRQAGDTITLVASLNSAESCIQGNTVEAGKATRSKFALARQNQATYRCDMQKSLQTMQL